MKSKKKVGLVAVLNHNYGSQLQTFALHYTLKSLGVDNEIIKYKQNPLKQVKRILNPSFFLIKGRSIAKTLKCKIKYPVISKGLSVRSNAFERFKNQNCEYSPFISSREVLIEYCKKYKAVILGSDQVWHPANLEMDYFTLSFVPNGIPRIAYAPSFGVASIPTNQIEKTRAYLSNINEISVREVKGAEIVRDLTDKDTPVVCDPTALVTKDIWDVVRSSKRFTDEKYIFCYFLGKNPEHRIFANRVKELTGYNIIALQHLDEFVKDDLGFADIKPFDVGPDDFISLIADAAIVLTDSFHGTMFSIYYHKDFLTFSRFNDRKRDSTNSRIDSILKILDLETRKIDSFENAHKALTSIDNWVEVDKRLDAFRAFSLSYLKNIIKEYELGKDTNRLDTVVDKERDECTGCTACVATCPMHAIDMKSDVEGFNYPSIDHEICVKCGMCLKVCPVGKAIQNEPCKAYAAKNNDVAIRTSSSSGGMFSSLANYILNKGGVVFGAGYNESFEVVHMAADNEQLLSNLRASKYVQSDLGDSFRAIENILKKNRWVLFVGTPCQVAGLKSFLKKEYDTLIVVDVLCYGVPSPMVFKSFIEFLQTKNKSKIKEFYFRDKKFGYSSPNVKAIYENGLIEEMTSDVKSFARSFFSGITTRPSCFNCAFKGMNRLADLTLGDLWIVDDISQDMDDETGTTLVFAYSDKAAKLVSDLNNVQLKEISIPLAIKKAGPMLYRSAKVNARRDAFFNDIQTLSYEECIRKYVPESLKSRLANIIKPIIKNTWLAKAVLFKNIKKLKISKESK